MTTKVPLQYSEDSDQQVIVGLSWDPAQVPFFLKLFLPRSRWTYDLDLICYIFDIDGHFIDIVSGETLVSSDQSGNIFHSGDSTDGEGDGDDERITINLANIPENIGHLAFIATCKSAHCFGEVKKPLIRIANGKTDENQFDVDLHKKGSDENACIFATISKENGTWFLEKVNTYHDQYAVSDWITLLSPKK